MKQIGEILGLKLVSATDETRGLIAAQSNNANGESFEGRLKSGLPGISGAVVGVSFNKEEIGGSVDGNKTRIVSVEVFIDKDGNILVGHGRSELLALFLGKKGKIILKVLIKRIKSAIGGSNEVMKVGKFEESANGAKAKGGLMMEDEEGSENETAEERVARGRAKEGNESRIKVGREIMAKPGAKSGARDAVLFGILTLGSSTKRIGESREGLRGVKRRPTKGLLPGVNRSCRFTQSHGCVSFGSVLQQNYPRDSRLTRLLCISLTNLYFRSIFYSTTPYWPD